MKVLVLGHNGQLASALRTQAWPADWSVSFAGRARCDLTQPDALEALLDQERPDLLVNAAAYTGVEEAEGDVYAAHVLNTRAPGHMAQWCAGNSVPMVHVSTDYVFSGHAILPYCPEDRPEPLNVYGATKAAGEAEIRKRHNDHVIVRTSWLFGPVGRNFLLTMLSLGRSQPWLRVVDDQWGAPTAAPDLARALVRICRLRAHQGADGAAGLRGTFHVTNGGYTTWFGFAAAVFRMAEARGMLTAPALIPIPSTSYSGIARRPTNGCLDGRGAARAFGVRPEAWERAVARVLDTLSGNASP